ncbi:hypothetical protein TNCT_90951 [Trichonephila clavata]|uniref:Uncharacterized protein n=1 Tax=Trichonephila clavata TaxID=2740835 RepID=A0A8X6K810_TRICU|nr:hypothetical protein TNCT_90951 [Trichonephila clavata]
MPVHCFGKICSAKRGHVTAIDSTDRTDNKKKGPPPSAHISAPFNNTTAKTNNIIVSLFPFPAKVRKDAIFNIAGAPILRPKCPGVNRTGPPRLWPRSATHHRPMPGFEFGIKRGRVKGSGDGQREYGAPAKTLIREAPSWHAFSVACLG